MAVERTEFLKLGGFDEQFFMFYEDIDFGLRATHSGIGVHNSPQWIVEHEVGHAARKNWNSALQTSYESGRYFHTKHGSNKRAYDLYVGVDSVIRYFLCCVKGSNPAMRRAYGALGLRAFKHSLARETRKPPGVSP